MIVTLLTTSATATISGALNVSVNPLSATVTVTGPNGYRATQASGGTFSGLDAGIYTVSASANGYTESKTVTVQSGSTAYVSLSPSIAAFKYYLQEMRNPGEAVTFSLWQNGQEVPKSRVTQVTIPGQTQFFGSGMWLTLGASYTARAESPRLGVKESSFTAQQRSVGNYVTIGIYQDGIAAG